MNNNRSFVSCLVLLFAVTLSLPGAAIGGETASERPVLADTGSLEDKRQASGDLDKDGDADIILARQPLWLTADNVPYKVMVNANGVLVDRTNDLATDSGLRGKSGFETPTDVGHITVADQDNDGWLDVVISVGPGQMPWIYINRCCEVGGCAATSCSTDRWLGLDLVEDRDPDMMSVRTKK